MRIASQQEQKPSDSVNQVFAYRGKRLHQRQKTSTLK